MLRILSTILKKGLLDSWKESLSVLFDESNHLQFMVIKTIDGDLVDLLYCEKNASPSIVDDLTKIYKLEVDMLVDHESCVIVKNPLQNEKYSWLAIGNNVEGIVNVEIDSGMKEKIMWSHCVMNKISTDQLATLNFDILPICSILSGDI